MRLGLPTTSIQLTRHAGTGLQLGANLGIRDVVAAIDLAVPRALGVAEGANVDVVAEVDLLDELLQQARRAEQALDQVAAEVAARDAVLLAKLSTAAHERAPAAVVSHEKAAQAAVLVQADGNGAAVHARPAEPTLAASKPTTVAARVEQADVPTLLATHQRVLVTVARRALHPLAHDDVLSRCAGILGAAAVAIRGFVVVRHCVRVCCWLCLVVQRQARIFARDLFVAFC